jgi:hypothetical protein
MKVNNYYIHCGKNGGKNGDTSHISIAFNQYSHVVATCRNRRIVDVFYFQMA